MLKVHGNDGELVQWISPEPCAEIRLDRDRAGLPHLGDLSVDTDDVLIEPHVCGLESDDLTGAKARPHAGEETKGKERHGAWIGRFHEFHQGLRLGRGQSLGTGALAAEAQCGKLGERIVGNPIALQRELEKPRNHAAAIVVGFARSLTKFKVGVEPRGREVGNPDGRAPFGQSVHLSTKPDDIGFRNQVLLEFVLLYGHVGRDGLFQVLSSSGLPIVGQREINIER